MARSSSPTNRPTHFAAATEHLDKLLLESVNQRRVRNLRIPTASKAAATEALPRQSRSSGAECATSAWRSCRLLERAADAQ